MSENLKNRIKLKQFIPLFAMLAAAAAVALIYTFITDEREAVDYVAVFGVALVPVLFPLYALIFGRELPPFVCGCICVHMAVSAYFGTALKFYDIMPWWDLFAHGFFGFNACITAYAIAADFDMLRSPVAGFIAAVCVAMALAAMWEIMEYLSDRIFGGDVQRVEESIAAGKSPLADTIEDMMITLAGCAAYAVFFFTDRACGGKASAALRLPTVKTEKSQVSAAEKPLRESAEKPNEKGEEE